MLSRLKTLPLTIILTILIWMYAESQRHTAELAGTQNHNAGHQPREQVIAETIHNLPIFVSGPPDVIAHYQIELYPNVLQSLVISGSPTTLQTLRQRSIASQIHAYLDITEDDHPTQNRISRPLRYSLPEGITLLRHPCEIEFQLTER